MLQKARRLPSMTSKGVYLFSCFKFSREFCHQIPLSLSFTLSKHKNSLENFICIPHPLKTYLYLDTRFTWRLNITEKTQNEQKIEKCYSTKSRNESL